MKILESDLMQVAAGVPDGKHFITCTHDCPDACNIELTVENRRITSMTGDRNSDLTRGYLCEKTPSEIVEWRTGSSRLKYAMQKINGTWHKIEWDAAYNLICHKIEEYTKEFGGGSILHFHGAGAFGGLKRTFTRRFFSLLGSSVISGSICDSAGMAGQAMDFGDQRTHAPQDMVNSRFAIVWGKNPANTSPHFMHFLKDLRKTGAEIVLIDPIKTRTSGVCTEHITVAPGMDKYLALAMGQIIINEQLVDLEFIDNHTVGYDDYRKIALSFSLDDLATRCGIPSAVIRDLTLRYATRKPSSLWLGFGLQRYVDGGETFRFIDALGALTGNIGLSGGGVSHQNSEVQKHFDYSINLENCSINRRSLRKAAIAEDLEKANDPPIKMIFVTTVNPVAQCPNSLRVKRAFENTEFVVVADSTMSDTARCADLVLPVTRLLEEDDVTWGYGHHFIGLSPAILPPMGEAKSDFEIFQTLAEKLGLGEEMAGTVPEWINRILSPIANQGITYDALSAKQMCNPNLDPVAFSDYRFTTPSGKFDFIRKSNPDAQVDAQYPYRFLTVHHHLWLNSNMYSEKQKNELGIPPFAYVHPLMAEVLGLQEGEHVVLYSRIGEMAAQVRISDKYPPNAVAMYQGGSIEDGTCANLITDDSLISDYGEMAAYYSTKINLRK